MSRIGLAAGIALLVVFATGWLFERLAKVKVQELEKKVTPLVEPLKQKEKQFKVAYHLELQKLLQENDQLAGWMEDRHYWGDVLTELRRVLIQTEESTKKKNNVDAGIWVERMVLNVPSAGQTPAGVPTAAELQSNPELARQYAERYGTDVPEAPVPPDGGANPPPPGTESAAPPTGGAPAAAGTNAAVTLTLVCRAVSLSSTVASGNTDLAFTFLEALRTSPLFEPEQTQFSGNIGPDEPPGTFTFAVNLALKRPLKL